MQIHAPVNARGDIADQRAEERMERVRMKQLGNGDAGSADVRKEDIKALPAQF